MVLYIILEKTETEYIMYTYLLLAAIVMFASIFLHKLSGKLGVPALLAFILLGMLFSGDGLIKIHFDNYEFAEEICSTALAFIMFYGGFGTNIEAAKPIAAQSILLSSAGGSVLYARSAYAAYRRAAHRRGDKLDRRGLGFLGAALKAPEPEIQHGLNA